jgi:hypothetical protein
MQAQPPVLTSRVGGRVAFGCVAAFAIPFVLSGAFLLKQGLALVGHDPSAWVLVGGGALFAAVGVAFIAGAHYSMSHVSHELAMHEQNPDKPWLWREDWAQGYARETGGTSSVIAVWAFAILWNSMCLPLLLVLRREYEHGNTKVLLAAIFPAVGLLLLILAIYQTFKHHRYGTTICHFDGAPLAIGHAVRGDVELHTDITPENGFVFRLACIHAVTTGSGKNRSTNETVLWDDEQVVSASAAMRNPVTTRVPFEIATPPDAPTTDTRNTQDRTFWRLSLRADVPGVDLDTSFVLPLFGIAGVSEGRELTSYAAAHRASAAERQLDRSSGVTVNETADGREELVIRSRPTVGGFFGSALFLTIWNGAIYLMVRLGAPILFPIGFGLFDLLIVYGWLDYLFGVSTVRAGREGVSCRRTIFGMGGTTDVVATDIASVNGTADSQNRSFAVQIKLADGKTQDLARYLRSRTDADTVAARIEKAVKQ